MAATKYSDLQCVTTASVNAHTKLTERRNDYNNYDNDDDGGDDMMMI